MAGNSDSPIRMATPPPPPPPPSSSPPPRAPIFRGRIVSPWRGYVARPLLELDIRAATGAILNKHHWWTKWRHTDAQGALILRDKWFSEIANDLNTSIFARSTPEWHQYWLGATVPRLYAVFPTFRRDQDKRAYVDHVASNMPYNLIWRLRWWETHQDDPRVLAERIAHETEDDYRQGNETMELYGQMVWYFGLVLYHESLSKIPLDHWQPPPHFHFGTEPAVARAIAFMRAVHRGDVTKQSFAVFVPAGDRRPLVVDALWFHVDRILQELTQIRACITNTLEDVIEKYRLDHAETVTAMVISPGPVQETWMSDLLISEELKRKFVDNIVALETVPGDQKDWHPESNDQVLDLAHRRCTAACLARPSPLC